MCILCHPPHVLSAGEPTVQQKAQQLINTLDLGRQSGSGLAGPAAPRITLPPAAKGAAAPIGPIGPRHPPGCNGPPGSKGTPGYSGPTGSSSSPAPTNTPGAKGARGPSGPPGPLGPPGPPRPYINSCNDCLGVSYLFIYNTHNTSSIMIPAQMHW